MDIHEATEYVEELADRKGVEAESFEALVAFAQSQLPLVEELSDDYAEAIRMVAIRMVAIPPAPVEPLVVFALFHAEVGSDECNPLVDLFRTEEAACRRLDEETLDYEVEALESGQVEHMGADLDHLVEGSAWGNFDNEPFAWWIQRVTIID